MSDTFSIVAVREAIIFKVKNFEDTTTTSGIILTSESINKNDHHGVFGEVLAIGPGVKTCAVGDTILVNKFDAVPFPHRAEVLHFTTSDFVRGKLVK